MIGHCCYGPQCHIRRRLTIALLMVWQILCCWLGPAWWRHVGGISSIGGDLFDAIVGAVAVPIFFPIFSNWNSWFKKYRAGVMACAAWLRLLINDSSVYVLIFVDANASFMSAVHAVFFYSSRNTLRQWVFMLHPRHISCLDSCPSPVSFLKESWSSRFRGSDGWSGWKSVWMTNKAPLFAQSIQC